MSILNRIVLQKQQEVLKAKKRRPMITLDLATALPVRDFLTPLQSNNPAIIAEIKKASPSKGLIRADFDVARIATTYAAHGASCLSVLTDVAFFQGDPTFLALAKTHSALPVLRKDFIIDAYQIHESRALGADAILLIIALLDDHQLRDYCLMAQALKMAVLVESHSLEELERALQLPTSLMGINNRSLHTFHTDIQTSYDLKRYIPDDKIMISESGINTREDIKQMQMHGIQAFLIGETFMRAPDIGALMDVLMEK